MFRPGWSLVTRSMLAALVVLAGLGAPLVWVTAVPVAAATFLSIVEDVPLMPGLAEVPDTATVFDKPAGRIASTEAKGAVTAASVRQFYAETLPQLGWQPVGSSGSGATEYRRDAEVLQLTLSGRDGTALIVRFELRPNR
jgi:hypothetical protein